MPSFNCSVNAKLSGNKRKQQKNRELNFSCYNCNIRTYTDYQSINPLQTCKFCNKRVNFVFQMLQNNFFLLHFNTLTFKLLYPIFFICYKSYKKKRFGKYIPFSKFSIKNIESIFIYALI